jgi:formylglycine-generating enzyme required for sulfatase activity/cephalosporin-C deacetylase-like acetyl esterase/predicted Ser/Thr protein kinase
MIGKTLAHYEITSQLGKGGMGVVYKARDTHLDRSVAIKVLPPEAVADAERKRRFVQEAKAASALNHPNIVTIHDISQSDGVDFIAMEYVEGQTLDRLIAGSRLAFEQVIDYAVQISSALAAAHAPGIVHRDLKPTNIMVTEKGLVKVLDFGLAKLTEKAESGQGSTTQTMSPVTEQGTIIGTVAYMSPEQAEGKPIDARSDVFSFGSVLYEMVTGRRAFQGESTTSTLSAILRDTPTPVRKVRAEVPTALERVVNRCLEKDRNARYASGDELWKELTVVQSQFATRRVGFGQMLRKPQFAIPILALLIAIAVMIGWYWVHSSRVRWARTVALPEIARLKDARRGCAAFRVMQQAEPYLQGDQEFERLRQLFTWRMSFRTDPPGADLYIWDYIDGADNTKWMHLGRTPLESVAIPSYHLGYRITKPGFETLEGTFGGDPVGSELLLFQATLKAEGTSPPGMIRIPAQQSDNQWLSVGNATNSAMRTAPMLNQKIEEYWLDKYEVTNRQFKEFMDRGAYENKDYWRHPFVKEGRVIPWDEAMAAFRDATGRPGPATWEYGAYPKDQEDYPVGGISWYEAVAYAEFAGKSLPTVHHWLRAAGRDIYPTIMRVSNFAAKGPARVGSYRGMSPYGNYDMAGNVKEWCWNPSGADRYILGGAWNEPSYTFDYPDVRAPMDRSPVNGFRCAKYAIALPEELTGLVQLMLTRDRRGDKAVDDAIFQVYRAVHQYAHSDLKPAIEAINDNLPYWRLEKVSFQAAYGNERVIAYLHLPKNAAPPYQTIMFFPGADTLGSTSSQSLSGQQFFDFVVRSGRAAMYPIYKGTYERAIGGTSSSYINNQLPDAWRGLAIEMAKDLGRSLDYLETRPDIDHEKLAYCGLSMGAAEGSRMIALQSRLKAGLLLFGGCWERGWPPEVDPYNFAPRVRVPILMVNGKSDAIFPVYSSQVPLFQTLGTPEKDKKHIVMDGGHTLPNQEVIKEVLDWLDRYLGAVRTR